MKTFFIISSIALLTLFWSGCSDNAKEESASTPAVTAPALFDPMSLTIEDPDLIAGRTAWMATCAGCHLTGLGGAPKIADKKAWAPRIAKGLDTLYDHAINGFIGPTMTEMPPKGGYPDLADDTVKQAVRFVVFASQ